MVSHHHKTRGRHSTTARRAAQQSKLEGVQALERSMGITPATPVHEPPEFAAAFGIVFLRNTVTGVTTAPTPRINIGRGDVIVPVTGGGVRFVVDAHGTAISGRNGGRGR